MRVQKLLLTFVSTVLVTTLAGRVTASTEVALRATNPSVPLVREAINARIDHRYAITDHVQIAKNATSSQIEGNYTLSTADPAVVTKFTYYNGDEPIRGELFERDAAASMYATVTRARRDPGILEELGPGQFHYRVFPFAPSEMKKIEVRWESWLPARGRVVEYRAPLATPRTAVIVSLTGSVGSVRSDTHEIAVDPIPHGGVRVRSLEPRGPSSASEFVLRYELPAAVISSFVHVDQDHDAFVVLDVAPPDRLIERVKLEVDGANAVRAATPLPTMLTGERVTFAFHCHPKEAPLRARITGDLDGRPITFEKVIDVARASDASWTGTLWATTRAHALARTPQVPAARDEIVELAFTHDFTTPHTAFFAIPASETIRVQGQLADARRRKAFITSDLGGGGGSPITHEPMNAPPPRTADVEHGRSGSCAGCTVVSTSSATPSMLGALALGLVLVVRIRRRR